MKMTQTPETGKLKVLVEGRRVAHLIYQPLTGNTTKIVRGIFPKGDWRFSVEGIEEMLYRKFRHEYENKKVEIKYY
jgi:hypothetical protein